MPTTYRLPFLGYVALMKKSGNAGALVAATQVNVPVVRARFRNPDPNQYMPTVDVDSYPSQRVKGMKTPTVELVACYKPSWCTSNLFNSLIGLGTNNANDIFSIGRKDDNSGSLKIWDDAKCERLQFKQRADGGPIMVSMFFKSRFGDSEAPYGATDPATGSTYGAAPAFATPGSVDSGELFGMADTIISGLGSVRAYTLTLVRGQAWNPYFNGTQFASSIITGMFSGGASFDQSPDGTTIANSGTASITIGPSTTGIVIAASLVRDDSEYPFDVSVGNTSLMYSLVDLVAGANPSSITAAP